MGEFFWEGGEVGGGDREGGREFTCKKGSNKSRLPRPGKPRTPSRGAAGLVRRASAFASIFVLAILLEQRTVLHGCLTSNPPVNSGYADLYHTGLFPNQAAVSSFINFYSKFDFCEPPKVSFALSPAGLCMNAHACLLQNYRCGAMMKQDVHNGDD